MDIEQEVLEAEKRIRSYIRETPIEFSPLLGQPGNCSVYLKLENTQITGSFKLRGAMNKILSLSEEDREGGLVTASTGNHGAAFAYLLNKFGCRGTIYLPENAAPAKIEVLRLYGVEMKFYGSDCVETEAFAKETAAKTGQVFISPYNDLKIIGGQGTIGIELAAQLDRTDAVLVPVGGGGLVSGIAGYLKSKNEDIRIIGCQPENSAVMYESVKAGRIVELESKPTLSDGTAGGIERGAITFDLCKSYIDDFILVTEEEITEATKLIARRHQMSIEGAAALSVASFIRERDKFEHEQVVLIISGAGRARKIRIDKQ